MTSKVEVSVGAATWEAVRQALALAGIGDRSDGVCLDLGDVLLTTEDDMDAFYEQAHDHTHAEPAVVPAEPWRVRTEELRGGVYWCVDVPGLVEPISIHEDEGGAALAHRIARLPVLETASGFAAPPGRYTEADLDKTDDAPAELVLVALRRNSAHWVPEARLLGNVRAGDIVRSITELLRAMGSHLA